MLVCNEHPENIIIGCFTILTSIIGFGAGWHFIKLLLKRYQI